MTVKEIRISYDQSEFDFDLIVPFIQQSYWGKGRSHKDIVASFKNSFVIGFFLPNETQIAWARVTSDMVYHAYIFDLAVIKEFRGMGYGKKLVTELMVHPELVRVSGWMLSTRMHHKLYRQFGFEDVEHGGCMFLKKV